MIFGHNQKNNRLMIFGHNQMKNRKEKNKSNQWLLTAMTNKKKKHW